MSKFLGLNLAALDTGQDVVATHPGIANQVSCVRKVQPPDPWEARTPGDFVAKLRQLKAFAGMTYRELAARAQAMGDWLPHTTIASALGRDSLPRERMVESFVRACGEDEQAIADWVGSLRCLAMAQA